MNESLRTYTVEQLEALMSELGQPRFRAKQLHQWLYAKQAASYDEMTNIPASLRAQLAERFPLDDIRVVDKQVSRDGTRKYVFELQDGACVEAVGMPVEADEAHGVRKRLTVCFSTQVGCSMRCAFCATGMEGFTRNLSSEEMVAQIVAVQRDFDQRVSNVVAMGQGEPFLNYDNTLAALRIMNNAESLTIGARHITISTCGILEGIERLSREPEQFTLAISLHSAVQETRNHLMPQVSAQPLAHLKQALLSYSKRTNRRVTLEYLLIKGVNDGKSDLQALRDFCDGLLCHVNLLPMNTIDDSPFKPSSSTTVEQWVRTLERAGVETTMRKSRGSDIDGACGQLKNKRQ